MDRKMRIAKLQHALKLHQEAWDLVMEWGGAWHDHYPCPPGKSRSDWMVSMALLSGTIQEIINNEEGSSGENSDDNNFH